VAAADGRGRVCDWSSVRLVTPEGDFDGILSVGADVTEALEARRDLERTRHRLDRMIRANMLGELVSAFSHELNQPLAAILSNAQAARRYLAQEQPRVDDVRRILDQIVADDKRAAAVIERLRALMERGETLREDLALAPLIDEVVALVQPELDQQGIRLEQVVPADIPLVEAGRVEVQQVLLNLLVNAVRALEGVPESTRRITIAASNGDERVTLTVADTGPGIPADQIDRLFEPFHGDRDGQLGMGLAICRRILEAYGGSIQAESGDGGASFRFTLPVAAVGKQVSRG
jgi:signal transduction histidine kinase